MGKMVEFSVTEKEFKGLIMAVGVVSVMKENELSELEITSENEKYRNMCNKEKDFYNALLLKLVEYRCEKGF